VSVRLSHQGSLQRVGRRENPEGPERLESNPRVFDQRRARHRWSSKVESHPVGIHSLSELAPGLVHWQDALEAGQAAHSLQVCVGVPMLASQLP